MNPFPEGVTKYWSCESPNLSVLILTLPKRIDRLAKLLYVLDRQKMDGVEILVNSDEKTKTVGRKRQECLEAASGKYLAFIDDDDMVSGKYIERLCKASESDPDVITFDQRAVINQGNPFVVSFSLSNDHNQQIKRIGRRYYNIKRPPWHMCAWRAEIAKRHPFQDISYGEDWKWCEAMLPDVKTESRVNEVLHFYQYDSGVSECPG